MCVCVCVCVCVLSKLFIIFITLIKQECYLENLK